MYTSGSHGGNPPLPFCAEHDADHSLCHQDCLQCCGHVCEDSCYPDKVEGATDFRQFTDLMRRFGVEHRIARPYPIPDGNGQWRGTISVNFDVADYNDEASTHVSKFVFSANGEFVGLEYA